VLASKGPFRKVCVGVICDEHATSGWPRSSHENATHQSVHCPLLHVPREPRHDPLGGDLR
jgi:hypothetical protein